MQAFSEQMTNESGVALGIYTAHGNKVVTGSFLLGTLLARANRFARLPASSIVATSLFDAH
jgi:hypothetical protein